MTKEHQRLCTALKCLDDGSRDIVKVWADRAEKLQLNYTRLRRAHKKLNAALVGLEGVHSAIHGLDSGLE